MKPKKIRNIHTLEKAKLINILYETYRAIYIIQKKNGKQER